MCLGLSTTFHTFGNHSHEVRSRFLVLDMVGIVFLITGSFYPGVYYGFYCEPELTWIYWTMVRVLSSLVRYSMPMYNDRFVNMPWVGEGH